MIKAIMLDVDGTLVSFETHEAVSYTHLKSLILFVLFVLSHFESGVTSKWDFCCNAD